MIDFKTIFSLPAVYVLTGLVLVLFALLTLLDREQSRRYGTALFWLLYGLTFAGGAWLSNEGAGYMVIAMAVIVVAKQMGKGFYHESSRNEKLAFAAKFGNKLFVPAIMVGLITFLVASFTKLGALVGLGIGAIISFILALAMTGASPRQGMQEGRRLIDAIGWAAMLSQLLAALGFLFDKAGVGKVVSQLVSAIVPVDSAFAVVVAYCVGMALFTIVMGNAFAAFAVVTTGIGIPMVVQLHGGNPAIVGIIAMHAGYCGTLLTPMAANFNIVPAALLEMQDKYGIIKAQLPVAIVLLLCNIGFMYWLGL